MHVPAPKKEREGRDDVVCGPSVGLFDDHAAEPVSGIGQLQHRSSYRVAELDDDWVAPWENDDVW
jgi:hypothetical protein